MSHFEQTQDLLEKPNDTKNSTLVFIYLGYIFSGFFISQFVISLVLMPFLGEGLGQLSQLFINPKAYPEYKNVVLFMQAISTLVMMIVATILFERRFFRGQIFVKLNSPQELYAFGIMLAIIFSIPFITWIAEINQNLIFPEMLSGFEAWAKAKEEQLKILTEYITTFDSNAQFMFGLLAIAIFPAIGEELVFRGVFQTLFFKSFKNIHVAIWISAFLFSAIHLQFYGFVPRFLLGALFGYIYFWTGNILIPIAGHFANNGFSLFLLHMKNLGQLKMDVETTAEMPVSMLMGSFAIFSFLVYSIYRHAKLNKSIL